jgi:hypothetical protein
MFMNIIDRKTNDLAINIFQVLLIRAIVKFSYAFKY